MRLPKVDNAEFEKFASKYFEDLKNNPSVRGNLNSVDGFDYIRADKIIAESEKDFTWFKKFRNKYF